jgi:hypothetical protein
MANTVDFPSLIAQCVKRSREARRAETKQQYPDQARHNFCQFYSKANFEVWTFCAANHINVNDWIEAHKLTHNGEEPKPELYGEPLTHPIFGDGAIATTTFAEINKGVKPEELRYRCRICWGLGVASVVKGPLYLDNIPQKLGHTICWCRR